MRTDGVVRAALEASLAVSCVNFRWGSMTIFRSISIAKATSQIRSSFATRDLILHDGRALRRFRVTARAQAALACVGGLTLSFSAYGVAHAALGAAAMTGVFGHPQSAEAKIAALQSELSAMQTKVARIKHAAEVHAARVEQRQALITAVLSGKAPTKTALNTPVIDAESARLAADALAAFGKVEQRQRVLAAAAQRVTDARYLRTAAQLRKLGIAPERLVSGGTGGPFEPVTSHQPAAEANADAQFRSLFLTWKKLETLQKAVIAIPASQPVANVNFSSLFGVRSDPFRGVAAMHAGVDIPGAVGTPIYATADGIVARAERSHGYGNLVEVNHGRGISTRYGHLSKILVVANARVVRGQMIGLMGSTGRSTGSHLHYEVRIDGQAVNPIPFLQTANFLQPARDPAPIQLVAGGGDSVN